MSDAPISSTQRPRHWTRRYGPTSKTSLVKWSLAACCLVLLRLLLFNGKAQITPGEIQQQALIERITQYAPLIGQHHLDTRKHNFLQTRTGRDERPDLFIGDIKAGITQFWKNFQVPFATSDDSIHLDEQIIKGVVEELMGFNGWVTASCSLLVRPFEGKDQEDAYSDLTNNGQMYYFAVIVHSADHFVIDQLAVIVQLARRLGTSSVFVSIVDYASTDSTPFLCDMIEMVLTLLQIPFRIRHVPSMTENIAAAYYPMEEAYTRNLALETLHELHSRRGVSFASVIWLKGFVCPNDLLESLRISNLNKAAMTCSMDWKEQSSEFVYNDRWRARDMEGNLFRGSKASVTAKDAPPKEVRAQERFAQHLPFQVFCCESGSHVVDPHLTYYAGISYRSTSASIFNASAHDEDLTDESIKPPGFNDGACMDATQMYFCRDLWLLEARKHVDALNVKAQALEKKGAGIGRNLSEAWESLIGQVAPLHLVTSANVDRVFENYTSLSGWNGELLEDEDLTQTSADANLKEKLPLRKRADTSVQDVNDTASFIPNTAFPPARILANPRCVTTYAGVSHTQLYSDLFGSDSNKDAEDVSTDKEGYVLEEDDWLPAPETFVCQEMRTTGGRTAPKQQRRAGFFISRALRGGWHPSRRK